jgi:hypothetical protein
MEFELTLLNTSLLVSPFQARHKVSLHKTPFKALILEVSVTNVLAYNMTVTITSEKGFYSEILPPAPPPPASLRVMIAFVMCVGLFKPFQIGSRSFSNRLS